MLKFRIKSINHYIDYVKQKLMQISTVRFLKIKLVETRATKTFRIFHAMRISIFAVLY